MSIIYVIATIKVISISLLTTGLVMYKAIMFSTKIMLTFAVDQVLISRPKSLPQCYGLMSKLAYYSNNSIQNRTTKTIKWSYGSWWNRNSGTFFVNILEKYLSVSDIYVVNQLSIIRYSLELNCMTFSYTFFLPQTVHKHIPVFFYSLPYTDFWPHLMAYSRWGSRLVLHSFLTIQELMIYR